MRQFAAIFGVLVLVLAGCGDDDAPTEPDAADEQAGDTGDDEPADGDGDDEDGEDGDDGETAEGCALDEPVPVGVVFSQTGGAAVYGESQRNAVELAADELNEAGEITYELVIEDDASTPEQGITVYERLIQQNQVSVLIGPTLSNVFFSAGPIAQETGVPALGVSTTADGITDIGDYIFRNSLTEAQVIPQAIAAATEEFGLERVAVLYSDDDAFTVSGYEIFVEAIEEQGLEITTTQSFATGDTDLSAQLTVARDSEPDALMVSALAEEAAVLLTQADDLGIDVPVVGGNGFNSPAIIEQAGDAAEGVVVGAAWNAAADDPLNEDFKAAFEDAHGRQPDQFAAQAYAGMNLVAAAVENACSAERDAIRDALDDLEDVETVLGNFSFTDNRDADHEGVIQIVEDGRFAVLQ